MLNNYKQFDECFISNKAFAVYSQLVYDEQCKIKLLFKSIAVCTPEMLPVLPIQGIPGNYRWKLEKYSLILRTFQGRLVVEDIVTNIVIDQLK